MEKDKFDFINNTDNDVVAEYLYYDIVNKHPNIDFSLYKELVNGVEVISIDNYHRCLLENDNDYKTYVIEEVLYDIDKFGYYANEYIENSISYIPLLLQDFNPPDFDEETWSALSYLSEKHEEKDELKRKRKYGKGRYARVNFKKN